MPTKLHLGKGHSLLPLGLLTLTSCLTISPSQARAVDNASLTPQFLHHPPNPKNKSSSFHSPLSKGGWGGQGVMGVNQDLAARNETQNSDRNGLDNECNGLFVGAGLADNLSTKPIISQQNPPFSSFEEARLGDNPSRKADLTPPAPLPVNKFLPFPPPCRRGQGEVGRGEPEQELGFTYKSQDAVGAKHLSDNSGKQTEIFLSKCFALLRDRTTGTATHNEREHSGAIDDIKHDCFAPTGFQEQTAPLADSKSSPIQGKHGGIAPTPQFGASTGASPLLPTPQLAQIPNVPLVQDQPPFRPEDLSPQPPSETPPEPLPPSPTPDPEELLESPPPIPTTPEPVPGEVPEIIRIQRFEFEGNTVVTDEELAEATAKFTNRDLRFAEVFEVRSVITELYRKRGYITSGAIIPPQTFKAEEGVVTIQVVEGGLEAIEVRGTQRLKPDYIRSRIGLVTSTPLDRNALLEALQILQLNPLIQSVSAELTAGTRPGSSLLIVQVEEAETFSAQLSLNNNRSPTIGTFETRLEATEANLSGRGDSLSVGYSNTDGSNGLDASYTLPLNPQNGTFSFSTGVTFSNVVESPFDRIDIDANSRYYELTFRQPLSRTLTEEFALGVTLTNQSSKVTVLDVPARLSEGADEEGRTSATALRFFQEWTRRTNREVFAARSQFSLGLGILGATTNEDAPDSRFLSWRGQVQWVRLLAPETVLILRGDVQLATQSLLALEQIGIGGQDTVRGYRQNVFLTDNGALASAEVRLPILRLPEQNGLLQLAPFIDIGAAFNSSGNPLPDPDPNILVSAGLGLRFQLGDNLTARFDWGIPLVDVATREEETLQENGLYFSINFRFF